MRGIENGGKMPTYRLSQSKLWECWARDKDELSPKVWRTGVKENEYNHIYIYCQPYLVFNHLGEFYSYILMASLIEWQNVTNGKYRVWLGGNYILKSRQAIQEEIFGETKFCANIVTKKCASNNNEHLKKKYWMILGIKKWSRVPALILYKK